MDSLINTPRATWRDYLELTKPRVVALMILTALIGMCMAVPGFVPWQPLVLGNLGIALCAGAAAAINHLVDERIDRQMSRTRSRPVATGTVSPRAAAIFAACLTLAGITVLVVWVNTLTARTHRGQSYWLCLCVHHVFEACDASKHRDWGAWQALHHRRFWGGPL